MAPFDKLKNMMSSHTERTNAPAPLPPSLNAGDLHGYWHDNSSPPPATTLPTHTPYLGLQARLSQVWINRWTVLLALIICRLLLATKDIIYDVARAKEEALAACTSVENVGSAMASMPHYMSEGVNALAADGVTQAVGALMSMLMLSVTGVEEIVLFVVHWYTQMYVCLITLAVSGSLHVAIEMIEGAANAMNHSISTITSGMSSDIDTFQNALNKFLGAISIPLIGGSSSKPQINLTGAISALNNIKIDPTTLDADLTKLNSSIPNFAQVQNLTDTLISTPFELAKKAMNDSIANYTFDKTLFEVAPKQALTFCSDNDTINNFFDNLTEMILKARSIIIGLLIALAIIVCIPMGMREVWRWKSMRKRSQLVQNNAYDPMDVLYISSRPYTTTAGLKLASFFKGEKQQILARWFVAYATSLPALFVLALGLSGLFSCVCQYFVLRVITRAVPELAEEVGDFANVVVAALTNASTAWADSANSVISTTNTNVNNDLFGWVNITTTGVNNTLNSFVDEMNKELNATFGGTMLYDPIMGVMNCLIGLKIAGIEAGLTWVHDNAHVTFPEFRTDLFSLGAAASVAGNGTSSTADSFLANPGGAAADGITNAVQKVADKLESQIHDDAIISGVVVGVWVFVLLIGLVAALVQNAQADKTRAEGGAGSYAMEDLPNKNNNNNKTKTNHARTPQSPRSPAAQFPQFGGAESAHPREAGDGNGNPFMGAEEEQWEESQGEKHGHVARGTARRQSVDSESEAGNNRAVSSYGYLDEKRYDGR